MSTNAAIVRLEIAAPPGRFLAASVGCYFAFRYATEYLFFQSSPRAGAAFSVALNLLFFAVVLFHSLGAAPNTLRATVRVPAFRAVIAFLLVALCSLVWSATVSVGVAFAYWCGVAADVGMVVLLLRNGPAEPISASLMKGYVWGALLIAVITWLSPTMQWMLSIVTKERLRAGTTRKCSYPAEFLSDHGLRAAFEATPARPARV